MPPTPDKIPDKVPFDIYAMLVILTFLATGGATLMINDRLSSEWQFWADKAKIQPKATHLTLINPDPAKYPEGLVVVQDQDKEEWKLIEHEYGQDAEFPLKEYDWPTGYDPAKYQIKYKEEFLGPATDAERRAAFQKMADAKISGSVENKAATPTVTPPADAPKDAPKDAAPKDAAPKDAAPKDAAPKDK